MSIDSTLCQLGRFLDEWAQDEASVRSVTVSEDESASGETLAEVKLDLPVVGSEADGSVGCTPSVTPDGDLALTLETGLPVANAETYEAEVEPVDAEFRPDGTVTVSLTVSDIDEQSERSAVSAGEVSRREPADDEDESIETSGASETQKIPPFRDSDRLQEVYETHETFAEMAESLDMDVTGETVRRYMIDNDIHQPDSYESTETAESPATTDSSGTSDQSEMPVRLDGVGLPDGVTTEELIETVSEANTIYEVEEELGMDRMEAHSMLKDLNMVDLVLGRLSNDTSRDTTREDVVERLQDISQARAH